MASKYIRLMEEYKLARKKGDEDRAMRAFKAAKDLLRSGKVSDEELEANLYL